MEEGAGVRRDAGGVNLRSRAASTLHIHDPQDAAAALSILYRSGMNPKIKRNCFYSRKYSVRVISSRQSFITVTQHIPDKRFQMVR